MRKLILATVMSSTIIAGFELRHKVRCHMGAVEKGLAQLKPKIFHAEVTFRLRSGQAPEHRVELRQYGRKSVVSC